MAEYLSSVETLVGGFLAGERSDARDLFSKGASVVQAATSIKARRSLNK